MRERVLKNFTYVVAAQTIEVLEVTNFLDEVGSIVASANHRYSYTPAEDTDENEYPEIKKMREVFHTPEVKSAYIKKIKEQDEAIEADRELQRKAFAEKTAAKNAEAEVL